MDKQTKVPQPKPNDGVRDEADVDEAKVGADPAVSRVTGQERDKQVSRDPTEGPTDDSSSKVVKLCSGEPTRRTPLLYEDHHADTPCGYEIDREKRVERTRLSREASGRNLRVVHNQVGE